MDIPPGKFATGVATRQVGRWQFRLLEPLAFNDPIHGWLKVPATFESDLASIRVLREVCRWSVVLALLAGFLPWISSLAWLVALGALLLYALVVGYGMRAAILHDWLYCQAKLTRSQCDAVYWRAQRSGDGMARWRAGICWVGVRLAGYRHYGLAAK